MGCVADRVTVRYFFSGLRLGTKCDGVGLDKNNVIGGLFTLVCSLLVVVVAINRSGTRGCPCRMDFARLSVPLSKCCARNAFSHYTLSVRVYSSHLCINDNSCSGGTKPIGVFCCSVGGGG